jgi:hypothetical protein
MKWLERFLAAIGDLWLALNTDDDADDFSDGYPGETGPMCMGTGESRLLQKLDTDNTRCIACGGTGVVA